jgi:hypothetical protein
MISLCSKGITIAKCWLRISLSFYVPLRRVFSVLPTRLF